MSKAKQIDKPKKPPSLATLNSRARKILKAHNHKPQGKKDSGLLRCYWCHDVYLSDQVTRDSVQDCTVWQTKMEISVPQRMKSYRMSA